MNKRFGLASLDGLERTTQQFSELGTSLIERQSQELSTQLEVFQSALANFATEHRNEIRENPKFRSEFTKMCNSIGVDPLASSSNRKGNDKSFWASLLGKDVNDFYYELGVKIIEICRFTRNENGGIISVKEVSRRLTEKSLNNITEPILVTEDDIEQAVKQLEVLGQGITIESLGNKNMIRSIPKEISNDQNSVLEACSIMGHISVSMLRDNLGWSRYRCLTLLQDMVASGILWIDDQPRETLYWTPSWIEML